MGCAHGGGNHLVPEALQKGLRICIALDGDLVSPLVDGGVEPPWQVEQGLQLPQ